MQIISYRSSMPYQSQLAKHEPRTADQLLSAKEPVQALVVSTFISLARQSQVTRSVIRKNEKASDWTKTNWASAWADHHCTAWTWAEPPSDPIAQSLQAENPLEIATKAVRGARSEVRRARPEHCDLR